jgi:hypothetical protein
MSERHRIDVYTNVVPNIHRAHCTCGWSSQIMKSRAQAEGEGDDHVVYMTSVIGEEEER